MNDLLTYFITWTTYGTWLPGDARGWRKSIQGFQPSQPDLEAWRRNRLAESPVLLNRSQRDEIENVCREHAQIRGWVIHAINARSNHVHVAVTANKTPEIVRDQFKANATRALRQLPNPITNSQIWTRGGDCEIIDGEENLERVVRYIDEEQDQK